MQNVQEVVRTLLKNGAKRIDNIVVKGVTVARKENYDRLSLSLAKPVRGFVQEDGTYTEGETRVIFVSTFSVGAILGDNEDTAFAKRKLLARPKLLELVLSYAKIDIIQEEVKANEEYKNPFATDPEPWIPDHDTIINHVINIELGRRGLRQLDKLEDRMFNDAYDDGNGNVTSNEEEL